MGKGEAGQNGGPTTAVSNDAISARACASTFHYSNTSHRLFLFWARLKFGHHVDFQPLPNRKKHSSNRTDLQTAAMGAGPSTEAEREPLLTPTRPTTNGQPVNSRVYRRRWLVLCLFSLLGFMQGMVWNFWGPIQNSAVRAFGFSKSDIAVLVLWGPVGFIPWLLFMWLMDKKGEFGTLCPMFVCGVCLVVFTPGQPRRWCPTQ